MRKTFLVVVTLFGLLVLTSVVVFRNGLGLSWLDSVYFTVSTVMTVGYGDINLQNAPPGVKVFGIFLMLSSAALMAATIGILTDTILKIRLEQILGLRKVRMKNHIVLCGLGHVGIRVLEQVRKLGEPVVVIEKDETNRFVGEAKAMGVAVVVADVRLASTLERANIREARSIIAATDDDLLNLEVALNAREVRPDIRVVLRMFDNNLASKIRSGFGIKTTFSTSALAAPAFAMAAVEPAVVGSFYLGEDLVLILQLVIAEGSELAGVTVDAISKRGGIAVLCHEDASGEKHLHPAETQVVKAGDRLTVSATPQDCPKIKAMSVAR